MAPPRTYRCDALTLKKMPLGEADILVTLYTKERGIVRAVGKGARKSASKLVGHLEPLTLLRISVAEARTLDIITQAQVLDGFTALKTDLNAISKGLYLAEMVDGFGSESNPNPELFELALNTLQALGRDPDGDMALRFFELHLLEVSGMLPELYCCVECRKELSPRDHRFSPNAGGVLCPECTPADAHLRPLSLRALKVLRLMNRGQIEDSTGLDVDEALARELKSLLSATVGYWLGKEIRTNSFLEQLRSEGLPEVYI